MTATRRTARRRVTVLAAVVLTPIALILIAGYVLLRSIGVVGPSDPGATVEVVIPQGSSAADIGQLLEEKGVVRSALGFEVVARLDGRGQHIQAGRYELRRGLSARAALAVLEKGATAEFVRVTFPEGSWLTDFATRLAEATDISAANFLGLATSGEIRSTLQPDTVDTLEGLLFPSTYQVVEEDTGRTVIKRLVTEFERRVAALDFSRAKAKGLSRYEAVIVASMIEAEARVPQDRPKIAEVIYNRLEKGMRLEIDATIHYALGRHKRVLTASDLEVRSPYNTRMHYGLPPTPIGAPGLASLTAALNPAEGDLLYYVVKDCQGRHAFSASYDRFLENKAAYEQLEC